MDELAGLTGEARKRALDRFHPLQPHLENDRPLKAVATAAGIPFRTAQRWVSLYRQLGLAALARRNERTPANSRWGRNVMTDQPPPRTLLVPWWTALAFRELAKLSLPIRPTKPIPKHMPEATSPQTSEPCSASRKPSPSWVSAIIGGKAGAMGLLLSGARRRRSGWWRSCMRSRQS
jgi:hypothetical protein